MRLTNEETKIKLSDTKRYDLQDHKMFTKLSQYEDIDEELGIDFITLSKVWEALKSGAWFRNPYYNYKNQLHYFKSLNHDIDVNRKCFDLRMDLFVKPFDYSTGGTFFFFKDYGKTWALTEGELL